MTAKISIIESDVETRQKLVELIAAHPEFDIAVTDDAKPVTKVAQVMVDFKTSTLIKRISEIFMTIGIPANIKGYHYLREAIRVTVEYPRIMDSITKELYPEVAKVFNTTPSKVERAIRHSIEVGWARGKIENLNNIFGVKVYNGRNDRPTNGEFIALLADKLLLDGDLAAKNKAIIE